MFKVNCEKGCQTPGYSDNVPSNEIISKETIKEYFHELINEYDISKEENINKYILNLSNII